MEPDCSWTCLQISIESTLKSSHSVSQRYTLIQTNQSTTCNNFSSLLLDVYVQLNMFGRPHAHHQKLNNCSSNLWFYRWSVVIAVLLVVVGPVNIVLLATSYCYIFQFVPFKFLYHDPVCFAYIPYLPYTRPSHLSRPALTHENNFKRRNFYCFNTHQTLRNTKH
jgi:hypothetical protein